MQLTILDVIIHFKIPLVPRWKPVRAATHTSKKIFEGKLLPLAAIIIFPVIQR